MGIYKKLAAIQNALIAPKGQFNAYGKYAYRSCEDILKAVKPLCNEHNCVLYLNNKLVNVGDRNYVEASAVLYDLENDERIISTAHAKEEETKKGMDGSQITGAASSYARKYALAGLFCIDNEADSDATNTHGKQKVKEKPKEEPKKDVVTSRELDYLRETMKENGVIESTIYKLYKVSKLEELTTTQGKNIVENIAKIKAKQEEK